MRAVLFPVLLTFAVFFPATGSAQNELSTVRVEQPWARASIGASRPAVAYLTLINEGEDPVRIVGFEAPVAGQAEPHRTVAENGMMRMQPAGTLDVPAGERIVLEPGGLHLMLMDLAEPLEEGESFPLTVRFEDGAHVTVTIPVLGVGARGPEADQ
ncbi:MAG: hypothetical protein CMF04_16190 [Hyphomonas sp.]|nr:hypothetical protein [Hyphomonas sp.]